MEIKIGVKGKILGGGQKDWFVLIQDDSEKTGGYLILQSKTIDFTGEGYDDWVKDKKSLEKYFVESDWDIAWLN